MTRKAFFGWLGYCSLVGAAASLVYLMVEHDRKAAEKLVADFEAHPDAATGIDPLPIREAGDGE